MMKRPVNQTGTWLQSNGIDSTGSLMHDMAFRIRQAYDDPSITPQQREGVRLAGNLIAEEFTADSRPAFYQLAFGVN